MNSKAKIVPVKLAGQTKDPLDWIKWTLVWVLLLGSLIGNYYYSQEGLPVFVRTAAWMAIMAVAAFLASRTQKGQRVMRFVDDARAELRKVIWPKREEVVQTTLAVAAMVVVLSLVLWGIDGLLVWLISKLTG